MMKKKTHRRIAKKKAIGDKQQQRSTQRAKVRSDFDGLGQLEVSSQMRNEEDVNQAAARIASETTKDR